MTDEQIDEHVNALMRTPITYDGKLYRFKILKKASSWLVVVMTHHIVSDAWSMTIIDDAILHACEALIKGEEPVLNIAPYTDVVAKEQEYFASKKYQKDKAFWSEMKTGTKNCIAKLQDKMRSFSFIVPLMPISRG
jgi:hypothetical protein